MNAAELEPEIARLRARRRAAGVFAPRRAAALVIWIAFGAALWWAFRTPLDAFNAALTDAQRLLLLLAGVAAGALIRFTGRLTGVAPPFSSMEAAELSDLERRLTYQRISDGRQHVS